MEETTFTLILADGSEITGEISGNNLITQQKVMSVEDADLIGATLNGQELVNATCCNLWEAEDGTHIILREKNFQELQMEVMNSKLEYLAMMTDVEID